MSFLKIILCPELSRDWPIFLLFMCDFYMLDILNDLKSVPTCIEVFPIVLLLAETILPQGNPFTPLGALIIML